MREMKIIGTAGDNPLYSPNGSLNEYRAPVQLSLAAAAQRYGANFSALGSSSVEPIARPSCAR